MEQCPTFLVPAPHPHDWCLQPQQQSGACDPDETVMDVHVRTVYVKTFHVHKTAQKAHYSSDNVS